MLAIFGATSEQAAATGCWHSSAGRDPVGYGAALYRLVPQPSPVRVGNVRHCRIAELEEVCEAVCVRIGQAIIHRRIDARGAKRFSNVQHPVVVIVAVARVVADRH